MKLIFTNFTKFSFWNMNLKVIPFSNFKKMQKNVIFIFQKNDFWNYTFHTRIWLLLSCLINFYFFFLMHPFVFHFYKNGKWNIVFFCLSFSWFEELKNELFKKTKIILIVTFTSMVYTLLKCKFRVDFPLYNGHADTKKTIDIY